MKVAVNIPYLEQLVKRQPERSIRRIAKRIGVSEALLRHLLKDRYEFSLKEENRHKISSGLGGLEWKLFPKSVGADSKKHAS